MIVYKKVLIFFFWSFLIVVQLPNGSIFLFTLNIQQLRISKNPRSGQCLKPSKVCFIVFNLPGKVCRYSHPHLNV